MIHWQKKTLKDQEITLTSKDAHFLGPNLELKQCRVILRTNAKALTITRTKFVDCRIEAKTKMSNFRWDDASLKGCTFTGMFSGCDFGKWPEDHDTAGEIQTCDFSQAILDGCRFLQCDMENIKLPRWPCFTVFQPTQRITAMKTMSWPGKTATLALVYENFPSQTGAVTEYAPQIIKQFGGSEDELKKALETLGGVYL